jgi:signal transduction histidine kinase
VVGDADRFEQVLWAILENAAKYSDPGTQIEVRIDASPNDQGELVAEVAVSDAGHGMDPATAAQAFDQFFRGAVARERAPDGSGIGLYAARGLARAMGGDILLSSLLGRGTTLRIRLPAEPVGADAGG